VLKILQISDLHILPETTDTLLGVDTEFYFRQVLKAAHAEHGPFDLILVSGDLAQGPCPASYRRILKQLQSYGTTTLCLPGNHDDFDLMQAILNEGVVSCRKHLRLHDWQIVCLNSQKPGSPVGELRLEELDFLEECLTAQPDLPALIAVHHHCVATGSGWLDSMQIENSAALLVLLERHPQVKAITYGHVHQEMTASHAGIGIFSAPATCFQFEPHSSEFSVENIPPGYRIFELFEDGSLESTCFRLSEPLRGLKTGAHGY
jgi:Icc protein